MIRTLLTAALFLAAPLTAQACRYGTCHACRNKVIHHQQYYVPQVSYFVGAPVRVEAIVKKELESNPLYQEFKQFQAWRQAQTSAPQRQTGGALATHCAKCHGVNLSAPKGELFFDSGHSLPSSSVTAALRAIKTGEMPKGGKLTAEEKGALMDELLELDAGAEPTVPATPPLPPSPEQQGRAKIHDTTDEPNWDELQPVGSLNLRTGEWTGPEWMRPDPSKVPPTTNSRTVVDPQTRMPAARTEPDTLAFFGG